MSVAKNCVWNGSGWADAIPHVWNGSAWVKTHTNVWNGSGWVQIPNWESNGPYPGVPMTSNTAPSPFTVQRSSIYSSGYEGYKAFNQDYSDAVGWAATGTDTSPWIRCCFATSLRSIRIRLCNRTRSSLVNGVIDAVISGSNDGTNWTQIGSIAGRDGGTSAYASDHYCWNSEDTYSWVQLSPTNWVNKTASGDKYVAIGEIYIYGLKAT